MGGMRDLTGKRVLVTGGSSGIGLATAKELKREGARIILVSRRASRLKRAKSKVGPGTVILECDVADPDSIKGLETALRKKRLELDVLINCAGIVEPFPIKELTDEQIRGTIETDLIGGVNMTKGLLPLMGRPGYIVNVSSMAGLMGIYGYTAYSAAKFGLIGFSEALRMEMEPEGIGVSVVVPQDVDTPQLDHEKRNRPGELEAVAGELTPLSPDRVARAIVRGIKRGTFMIYPTASARYVHLAYRLFPALVRSRMDSRVRRSRKDTRVKGENA